ncbi:MAG: response regulator [Phycisphaerae bacterium]|nr:response regulator [Phycisphaerae bacterium]
MANAKRILIVDDDADIRAYLSSLLEDKGYTTSTAEDGAEALKKVRQEKPDLVILDLMMPHQTGTDFYRKIVRDKGLSDTPVIVVSGLAGRELALKEPAAVFDKPIDPDEFIAAVEKCLG